MNRQTGQIWIVRARGRTYGKFLSRQEAEQSITRYSLGYEIPLEEFTVTLEKEYEYD